MKVIELTGSVNLDHQVRAQVPSDVPAGPVRLLVLVPGEAGAADVEAHWEAGVASEWAADLADPSEDIYTLNDGLPV